MNERAEMVQKLEQEDAYIRRLDDRTTVTYQLGPHAADSRVAVWDYRSQLSFFPIDYFEVRRQRSFPTKEEAVRYLEEHFDDPLRYREVSKKMW